MSYIRLIKSKNITLEDAKKMVLDKAGVPTDEELKKEYEQYKKDFLENAEREKEEYERASRYLDLGQPDYPTEANIMPFEKFKQRRYNEIIENYPIKVDNPRFNNDKLTEWFYDEWIDTDDDPIEEVK